MRHEVKPKEREQSPYPPPPTLPSTSPAPAMATAPKILLAKPGAVPGGSSVAKFARSEGESALLRSRLPPLNLLSDSWEFHTDRILPVIAVLSWFVFGSDLLGKEWTKKKVIVFEGFGAAVFVGEH